MDNQIQNLLNLGINLNKFYCIQVQSCDIVLQGWVTSSLMNDLNVLGYEFDYDKENNSILDHDHYLTEKDIQMIKYLYSEKFKV
jgi:hypothetical protein